MKNIIYLNNFMSENIANKRNSQNIYSQAANNKITGMLLALKSIKTKVTVLSSGLVNSKSGKRYYKEEEIYDNTKIIYCSIIDFPLINTISSIMYMYKTLKEIHSLERIDNIIFYNYKPEVAWVAYLAKKKLNIPITVEYEDGYSHIDSIKGLKALIFNFTENFISKRINSAIVVNSELEKKNKVPTLIVRGVTNPNFYNECRMHERHTNKKFTILYAGGLDKERGIDVLLNSLNYLKIDCKVVITGKGELKCKDERVEFLGFVSHDEVKKLMLNADLLIQCQLVKHSFSNESFPSKIFEYIATGNIIISSNIKEVIKFASDSIIYYENDDPKDLARKIEMASKMSMAEIENQKKRIKKLSYENLPEKIGKRMNEILGY